MDYGTNTVCLVTMFSHRMNHVSARRVIRRGNREDNHGPLQSDAVAFVLLLGAELIHRQR